MLYHKILSCVTLLIFASLCLFSVDLIAQEEYTDYEYKIEEYVPVVPQKDVVEEAVSEGKPQKSSSILKLAWEVPNYKDRYDIAYHPLWAEPKVMGEAYAGISQDRSANKGDTVGYFTYAAFRPFILDFDTFSFTFGASYSGSFSEYEERDIVDTTNGINTFSEGPFGEYWAHVVNFALLGSFPEVGVQVFLEVGHLWTSFRVGSGPSYCYLAGWFYTNL